MHQTLSKSYLNKIVSWKLFIFLMFLKASIFQCNINKVIVFWFEAPKIPNPYRILSSMTVTIACLHYHLGVVAYLVDVHATVENCIAPRAVHQAPNLLRTRCGTQILKIWFSDYKQYISYFIFKDIHINKCFCSHPKNRISSQNLKKDTFYSTFKWSALQYWKHKTLSMVMPY